jgi:hypothetical protein
MKLYNNIGSLESSTNLSCEYISLYIALYARNLIIKTYDKTNTSVSLSHSLSIYWVTTFKKKLSRFHSFFGFIFLGC